MCTAMNRLAFQRFIDVLNPRALRLPGNLTASFFVACLGLACQSQEQNILGTFELDVEVGCEGCAEDGPLLMVFDDESPSGMLGGYRFEFAEGQFHEGQYEFVYFDESSQLVLYPEEASADHFGLIGTTLQTDYSVGFNAIRERCNGLLNCVWKRSE